MNITLRRNRLIIYCFNCILEGAAVGITIFVILTSICVRSKEISLFVNIFMFAIGAAAIVDLVYFMLIICLKSLGGDPLAIILNFVLGVLCVIAGTSLILVLLNYCGSIDQYYLVAAGAITLLSGLLHLVCAILYTKKCPPDERNWPTRRKSKETKQNKKKSKDKV